MNAYMLRHEEKYRRWVLEYVGAWRERMAANGNLIPTSVGADGKVGEPRQVVGHRLEPIAGARAGASRTAAPSARPRA
jgi:hypothetical protein